MHPSCVICKKVLVVGQAVKVTRCGHMLHSNCLEQWFKRNSSCPDCRVQIIPQEVTTVHLRRAVYGPPDRQNVEWLAMMLRVKDIAITKLRGLLDGHEKIKKQLDKESANRILLEQKLQLAEHRCLEAEKERRDAERKQQQIKYQLSRTKCQLERLQGPQPYKKNASTQTWTVFPPVQQARPSINTRFQRRMMASIENIPFKKRPGISADANCRHPNSDVSLCVEIMRDPMINNRIMESNSIAEISIDMDEPLRGLLWSPVTKNAGHDTATGGGSFNAYRM